MAVANAEQVSHDAVARCFRSQKIKTQKLPEVHSPQLLI
jgi:hypothetical protein